jgi:hypothetical protein
MQKELEITDDGFVIHTQNGVDTRTAAMYVRELKEYTPLKNGFNLELAEAVLEQIKRTPLLWDQGSWRTKLFYSMGWSEDAHWTFVPETARSLFAETREQISRPTVGDLKEQLSEYVDPNTTCGTAMCFAGWVAELTGADHVVDSKMLAELNAYDGSVRREALVGLADEYMDYLLIPRQKAEEHGFGRWGYDEIKDVLSKEQRRILKERGFRNKTHVMVSISTYAATMLGFIAQPPLFNAGNSYGRLQQYVRLYTGQGPVASADLDAH